MTDIKELAQQDYISHLQSKVDDCKEQGQDMDAASWGYEQGVLISANVAIGIIEQIKQLGKQALCNALMLAESRQKNQRWIPVTPDTMPKEEDADKYREVLWLNRYGQSFTDRWNKLHSLMPIAWMHIPKYT